MIHKQKRGGEKSKRLQCSLFVKQNEGHSLHIRRCFWALCKQLLRFNTMHQMSIVFCHSCALWISWKFKKQRIPVAHKNEYTIQCTKYLSAAAALIIFYMFSLWKMPSSSSPLIVKRFDTWCTVIALAFGRNAKWMPLQWCVFVCVRMAHKCMYHRK